MFGITAYSAYVPRLRLDRALIAKAWGTAQGAGEIAVANYDEDSFTMAVEAASECIAGASVGSIDAVYFASTSSPYREKQIASFLATACDLPRAVQSADFGGSVRCGLSAVIAGFHALKAGARRDVLVAVGESRLAQPESELEGLLGDAGAALRLGTDGVLAELLDYASVSEEFTYFWRTDAERFLQAFPGKFSNTYGYFRDLKEAVSGLLRRQGVEPKAIAKLALFSPDARAAADLGKQLGLDPKTQVVPPPIGAIGSAGAADALLALGAALDEANPGDLLLVGSYGEGADVLLLRVTEEIVKRRAARPWKHWLAQKLPLPSYEKYLKYRRVLELDEPGEAINNVLEFKELKQDVRLYGSLCQGCGTVQYPTAKVCLSCKAREGLQDHKIAKLGSIFTFTVDHLIANLEHPLPMAVIDMDGGGRLYLQVTDFTEEEVVVGQPVIATFRRLHEGGGNHNYFWKARPLR